MLTVIFLAAGSSKRMGDQNKMLLPFKGVPMVVHVAQNLLASKIGSIIAVVGHQRSTTESLLSELSIKTVFNPDYRQGLVSSVKAGITMLPKNTTRVMIALGDMPLLESSDINSMLQFAARQSSGTIIRPISNNMEFGHPVIFDTLFVNDIKNCPDLHSLKSVVNANKSAFVPFATENRAFFTDMDTPSEYKKLNP